MNAAASRDTPPSDILPVVPVGSDSNWGMWAFFALLLVGGVTLFSALSSPGDEAIAPSVAQTAGEPTTTIASPNPLALPPRFTQDAPALAPPQAQTGSRPVTEPPRRPMPPAANSSVLPNTFAPPAPLPPTRLEPATDPGPQVVFEQRPSAAVSALSDSEGGDPSRVTATRFANPGLTIPQGTVIPAVLETALDSTRAGGVRALVQRDVSSFDGERVLIPRGSRLYGEYEANLQPGQNRALVQWSRLIRPDGVTINLNSPSSDPLGRAGIKGKVDSKFLQRFGNALLQSVVDLGINVAVSEATDGVIVALPGSTQSVQLADQRAFQPTLKVKHGTSVSVFVARDLDFSTVES
ncbi:MAG: TrbI/VirB10 family protein [Pseudomonadota bacterium]